MEDKTEYMEISWRIFEGMGDLTINEAALAKISLDDGLQSVELCEMTPEEYLKLLYGSE